MEMPLTKWMLFGCLPIWMAFFAISGCAKLITPPRPIHSYTISYSSPKPTAGTPIPAVIRIGRFSAAPPFASDEMVFGSSDTQRGTYTFHKWQARPADLIASLMLRDFLESKCFAGVLPPAQRIGSTHSLDGIIESIYQKDENGRKSVVVGLAVTFISETETDPIKRIVFQKRYLEQEPLSMAEPRYFAEATSRAVSRLSETVRRDVARALSNATS